MRKIFVIWNPAAGRRSAKTLGRLRQYLTAEGLSFHIADTHTTQSAASTLRAELDESFTDLIIVGGDGTLNEAVNGLRFDIPVGIVPAGTGNDFVKMLPLGQTLDDRMHTAVYGKEEGIDLGLCNDRKFLNGVGIGFDGQIVEDMHARRVPLLSGHLAYYYHVLRILGGYKERRFRFEIDGESHEQALILLTVGNGSTFGGGFRLMPGAHISDGWLEVCTIGKIAGWRRFLNIIRLSKGSHGKLNEVQFYRGKKITVAQSTSLHAHIDGERMGSPPFTIQILPQALTVRVKG